MDAPQGDWGWVPPAVAAGLTGLLAWFARGWVAARTQITDNLAKSLSDKIDLRFDVMDRTAGELRDWVKSIDDKLDQHFREDREAAGIVAAALQLQKTHDGEIAKLRTSVHGLRGTVTGIALHTNYEGGVD